MYVNVSVSLPAVSEFAGIVSVTLPLLSVPEIPDDNPPPLTATVPVGVGLPLAPLAVTVAVSAWFAKIVEFDKLTDIVGAGGGFTVTVAVPDALV